MKPKPSANAGLLRRLVRLPLLVALLSEHEWFRRLHGGKWMRTQVDFPVCSLLWCAVPYDATPEYREAGWRGAPEFRDYDALNVKLSGDAR